MTLWIHQSKKHELPLLHACPYWQDLSPHAIYMRLKRLCERKAGGVLNVDEETHQQWVSGNRDQLSLALVNAVRNCGTDDSSQTRKAVRVGYGQHWCYFFNYAFVFKHKKHVWNLISFPAGGVLCTDDQGEEVFLWEGGDSTGQVVYGGVHASRAKVQHEPCQQDWFSLAGLLILEFNNM